MNVCFIYTTDLGSINHPLPVHSLIPLGFASVITCVKNEGNEVELLVFHNNCSKNEIFKKIHLTNISKKPYLYCLTAVASQMTPVLTIGKIIKKIDPNAIILLGGAHPTLNPISCISHNEIDMVCIGEGENAVPSLIEKLERNETILDLPNIWYKEPDGSIIKNPINPWIENLDNLPFIDREIWRSWIDDFYSLPPILIGRGCPNQCSYCSNHALKKISEGKYVRYRSPENIIQEIVEMKLQYPDIHNLYFEIETAGVNLENIFRLCDELSIFNSSINRPIEFRINISPNRVVFENKERISEKFIAANLKIINIGLESGSERIRNDILNRPKHSNEEFIDFCQYLMSKGIRLSVYAMVGLPTETESEFLETYRLLETIKPYEIQASIFHPYPGTKIFDRIKDMGYIIGEDLATPAERRTAVLSYPDFSREAIQEAFQELLSLNTINSTTQFEQPNSENFNKKNIIKLKNTFKNFCRGIPYHIVKRIMR